MSGFAQSITMALVTELLGLSGALLRMAFPSVDLADQIKLHFMMWSCSAAVITRRISRIGDGFRRIYEKLKCPRRRVRFAKFEC
jgi:hypothetical protein